MIRRALDHLEEILAAVLMALLCLIVGAEVVLRYLLTRPLSWTEELSVILFVWITMLGSSIALKRGEHFAVELLGRSLPPRWRYRLRFVTLGCIVFFAGFIFVYGCQFAWRNRVVHTPAMEISRAIPYAAIPVGGAFMLVRAVQMMQRLRRESPPPSEAPV